MVKVSDDTLFLNIAQYQELSTDGKLSLFLTSKMNLFGAHEMGRLGLTVVEAISYIGLCWLTSHTSHG